MALRFSSQVDRQADLETELILRRIEALADDDSRNLPADSEQRFFKRAIRMERSAGTTYAVGHAAVFGILSADLGGFKERIQRGAFSRAIRERQDTKFLINHDPNRIIGRVKNGTLQLSEDTQGLRFRCELPDTSAGRDLRMQLDSGLVDECSFAFTVGKNGQRWTREADQDSGTECLVRDLTDVDELLDCAAVVYPAYPGTDIGSAARALFPAGQPAEIRSHLGNAGGAISEEEEILRLRARMRAAKILFELE